MTRGLYAANEVGSVDLSLLPSASLHQAHWSPAPRRALPCQWRAPARRDLALHLQLHLLGMQALPRSIP